MELLANNRCFDGQQLRYRHRSDVLDCDMTLSLFLPPQNGSQVSAPLIYWLSGLTCTDENFVTKAGAQRVAAELGVAIVAPDTSPRGEGVADDVEGAYDFGLGAGFYVNALQEPWRKHYQMYSYITEELPKMLADNFSLDTGTASIMGHSMGGHGALTIALKNPQAYKSVSAFAPICSPIRCPWGQKALGNYLGSDQSLWRQYDTTELIKSAQSHVPMLVDQGLSDNFLQEQLKTELLEQACSEASYPIEVRRQEGYDHSYFFIASFIEDHLRFHAHYLK